MCALLAIVQFEVHFFQDGRWMLQSRFPGDERQAAIRDAVSVEASTRRPTKVVKETYIPHENRSETVTIYTGPLLKAAMDKSKALQGIPPPARVMSRPGKSVPQTTHAKTAAPRLAPNIGDLFWRSIISMGLSLTAATIVTAMVSWLMTHLPDFGIAIDAGKSSAILTLTYAVVFLLGVMSMFRFGTPIKRLISNLWQSAYTETTQAKQTLRAKLPGLRLKSKRSTQAAFEQQQTLAEMKLRRGDPAPTVDDDHANLDVVVIDEMPSAVQQLSKAAPEPAQQQAASPQEAQFTPLPAKLEVELPKPLDDSAEASFEAGQVSPAAPLPPTAKGVVPPSATFSPAINELQRSMALRFVTEVILPQIGRAQDDPVARRGAALFLTGAMTQLAGSSNLNPPLTMNLISTSVMAALPRHAFDAFMNQYDTHVSNPSNAAIIDDGRQAMSRFLGGQKNEGILALSLKAWRVPMPAVLAPSQANRANNAATPTDYYLLTEFRNSDAFMMDFHNHIVRQAVETSDGREIKHTGRGILARFEYADLAIQAAMSIAAKIKSSPGVPQGVFVALALNAGFGAVDDPLLSSTITKSAQTVLETVASGSVVCDAHVLANAHATSHLVSRPLTGNWLLLNEKSLVTAVG